MGKEKSEKKEKKEKKEKRAEVEGVKKVKKEKKDKKEKKEKRKEQLAALLGEAEAKAPEPVPEQDTEDAPASNGPKGAAEDIDMETPLKVIPKEALVPFANPLADEKQTRKVLKSVRKASKHKAIKRGVKEVVKCVRKSPSNAPSSSKVADPVGIVVLAADISPMDVISHIPVLCEDHNIPYIYVTSRAELGSAGNTKRPTSVVLVSRDRGTKVKGVEGDDADYAETYKDLLKLVVKAGGSVKI